ncbi:MAG: hypothetical protein M5R36_09890 [Deltaproteobacteria bacterium]|nr:hypothetical protein [Deltaproteobacteria bacterium]
MEQVHGRLRELRDEAARAAESDLPSLLEQLHTHQALAGWSSDTALPDPRSPYFARMRLREGGRVKEILLGYRTFIDADSGITIIDWRHAPVSRIFYTYGEGEDYEEEFPGGVTEGVVELRRVLTIDGGDLVRVQTPERCFARDNGEWMEDEPERAPTLEGGQGQAVRGLVLGTGHGGKRVPDVSALLDREQYALLEADDRVPLLVLGGAGSGKTTVALHRLAQLAYRDKERYRPTRMIVVVPAVGLVRLSKRLLEGLGMKAVRVTTFDDWIKTQARMLLRAVPKRVCETTPPRVSRFKRHPALLTVLPEVHRRREAEVVGRLRRRLSDHRDLVEAFAGDKKKPLLARLETLEKNLAARRPNPILHPEAAQAFRDAREAVTEEKELLFDASADRIELFSDRALLDEVVLASNGS